MWVKVVSFTFSFSSREGRKEGKQMRNGEFEIVFCWRRRTLPSSFLIKTEKLFYKYFCLSKERTSTFPIIYPSLILRKNSCIIRINIKIFPFDFLLIFFDVRSFRLGDGDLSYFPHHLDLILASSNALRDVNLESNLNYLFKASEREHLKAKRTLKLAGEFVRRIANGTRMPKPTKMIAIELMMIPSSTIPEYVSLLERLSQSTSQFKSDFNSPQVMKRLFCQSGYCRTNCEHERCES